MLQFVLLFEIRSHLYEPANKVMFLLKFKTYIFYSLFCYIYLIFYSILMFFLFYFIRVLQFGVLFLDLFFRIYNMYVIVNLNDNKNIFTYLFIW